MGAREIFESLKAGQWSIIEEWSRPPGALEDVHLEFKCAAEVDGPGKLSDDARADIAKALSGFANADGGVIVVGLKAARPADRGPDRVTGTCFIRGLPAFERAVQDALPRLTDPTVRGVEMLAIPSPTTADQGVVAIYVPASEGGPHRTSNVAHDRNERYYIRTSTSTGVMSHATLADRFGRRPPPRLRLVARPTAGAPQRFDLLIRNFGRGAAERPALVMEFSAESGLAVEFTAARRWHCDSLQRPQASGTLLFEPAAGQVIYPTAAEKVATAFVREPNGPFTLAGTIFALNAQPVQFDARSRWAPSWLGMTVPSDPDGD